LFFIILLTFELSSTYFLLLFEISLPPAVLPKGDFLYQFTLKLIVGRRQLLEEKIINASESICLKNKIY